MESADVLGGYGPDPSSLDQQNGGMDDGLLGQDAAQYDLDGTDDVDDAGPEDGGGSTEPMG